MNTLTLMAVPAVTALTLAFAAPAYADEPAPSKTRAEVKAELLRALADGSYKPGSAGYDPLAFVRESSSKPTPQGVTQAARATTR